MSRRLGWAGVLLPLPLGGRDVGRLLRNPGKHSLDSLPYAGNRCLPVREFLHGLQIVKRRHAGEGVPDVDQAVGGPGTGELVQFLGGAEIFGGFDLGGSGFFVRSKDRDVVGGVDCEGAHA